VQNKCFYPIQNHEEHLLDSSQDKINTFEIITVLLQVSHLPAAVTGFPIGIEFKLLIRCMLVDTFISTLVKKFLGKEFVPRLQQCSLTI